MKFIIFATLILLSVGAQASSIAEKTYPDSDSRSVKQMVLDVYQTEVQNTQSVLSGELTRIRKEQDFPELGSLGLPQPQDIWMISSGKSGAAMYVHSYLLGIPSFRKGTGMIEEYVEYLSVTVTFHIGEKVVVSFEKIGKLSL